VSAGRPDLFLLTDQVFRGHGSPLRPSICLYDSEFFLPVILLIQSPHPVLSFRFPSFFFCDRGSRERSRCRRSTLVLPPLTCLYHNSPLPDPPSLTPFPSPSPPLSPNPHPPPPTISKWPDLFPPAAFCIGDAFIFSPVPRVEAHLSSSDGTRFSPF